MRWKWSSAGATKDGESYDNSLLSRLVVIFRDVTRKLLRRVFSVAGALRCG